MKLKIFQVERSDGRKLCRHCIFEYTERNHKKKKHIWRHDSFEKDKIGKWFSVITEGGSEKQKKKRR